MSLLRQQPLAVQMNRESCLVLQLSRQGRHFVVDHFSQQHKNSLSDKGLNKDGIVSALDYTATHYQKIALDNHSQVEEQLLEKLPPQLKTSTGISYDYFTRNNEAEAVIGQRSALEELLAILAPLQMPVHVVEPAYQSVVRAETASVYSSVLQRRCFSALRIRRYFQFTASSFVGSNVRQIQLGYELWR